MIRLFNQYVAIKSILLVMLESLIVALSLVAAAGLRFWNNPTDFQGFVSAQFFPVQAVVVVVMVQLCFYYNNLYDFHLLRRRHEQLISLGESMGQACVLLGILYFLAPSLMLGRGVFLIGVVLGSTLIVASRTALDSKWYTAALKQKILILGAGELAETVASQLTSRPDLNLSIVGFLRAGINSNGSSPTTHYKVLGGIPDLASVVHATEAEKIIVALEERRQVLPVRELVRLRMEGIIVEDAQTTMSALSGRVWLDTVHPSWFVFSDGFRRSRTAQVIKRFSDVVFGITGLILSLPVMALVALAVRLDSKGPVIYSQKRVGLRGRYFNVLKFRSMCVDAERETGAQWASADDLRITRVGRFLRKFRFDELPQFINVIRGDMSFVGPRPERPEFVEELRKAIPYYDERHTVRPGITGWAQVQYEYGASVEAACRKLEYDLFYLKNMSFFFDALIIFRTVRTILSGHGGR
jgi:sugar transferase (PEP-CTERM system associated)